MRSIGLFIFFAVISYEVKAQSKPIHIVCDKNVETIFGEEKMGINTETFPYIEPIGLKLYTPVTTLRTKRDDLFFGPSRCILKIESVPVLLVGFPVYADRMYSFSENDYAKVGSITQRHLDNSKVLNSHYQTL